MSARTLGAGLALLVGCGGWAYGCIHDPSEDCWLTGGGVGCPPVTSTGTGGATGGSGGQGGGTGGTGGTDPCGGCGGSTPYCDEVNGTCEACLEHVHCTDADAARCDDGSCVPCTDHPHCAGADGADVCEAGSCVECTVDDDTACSTVETCDLVDFVCVDVAPHTVGNCEACANDEQCANGFACIPMQFGGNPHGHYCLEEDTGSNCIRPFAIPINAASINGEPSADYCGIFEGLATCEAVLALVNGWVCTNPNGDGSCGPDGEPEQPVPGALCVNIGGVDVCTYECANATQCLLPAQTPYHLCGGASPTVCGG